MSIHSEGGLWVPGEVWVPDGLHMAQAKNLPGIERALLFGGEQGTSGPTLFRATPDASASRESLPNIPDGLDPKVLVAAAAALALAVVTTVVVVKRGSKIVTWWKEVAYPRVSSRVLDLLRIQPRRLIDEQTELAVIGPVPTAQFADEVGIVVDDLREEITTEEAQNRLLLVFVAASIISEQMRKLRNARLKDADHEALEAAMDRLTTGDVVTYLNEILAERRAYDDETYAVFVEVFGGRRYEGGVYQPLTLDRVHEVLRLDSDDSDDDRGTGLVPA